MHEDMKTGSSFLGFIMVVIVGELLDFSSLAVS